MDVGNFTFKTPEPSEWKLWVNGNIYFIPVKGDEPCWFHRKMQELMFGFKWRKED